jgi:hypothetical protein
VASIQAVKGQGPPENRDRESSSSETREAKSPFASLLRLLVEIMRLAEKHIPGITAASGSSYPFINIERN